MSEEVLARLDRGERVAVQAVPGAGKTHLLLRACSSGNALILAYNTQLAAAVQATLVERQLDASVTCVTFHALCGRCLRMARDDAQLEDAVEAAERGELSPHDVPRAARVLVDEAQDVRELYVRLLRVLGLVGEGVAMMVAGDAQQLIFDWDEEHKATLDTLQRPERMFGGAWSHVQLRQSHRLTRPVAALVNAIFGSTIEAVRDGPPVEVRAPKSAFQLADVLRDVLCGPERDVLLLVDRRRGNRPLKVLLNTLSREGRRVHVHGVDADETTRGKLRCSTWWGAKGLECDTAVVLLPANAPRNPTYVALTRARRRLVLVLDPREPHAAVCATTVRNLLRRDDAPYIVEVCGVPASRALDAGAVLNVEASLARAERLAAADAKGNEEEGRLRLCNVDRWAAPRRSLVAHATARTLRAADEGEDASLRVPMPHGSHEDVCAAALRLALVVAEQRATGRVRAMEGVLHPTRLDADRAADALRAGFVGRSVPRFVTDDSLLADDLRGEAARAYAAMMETPEVDWVHAGAVALATLAWDDFDHTMRQLRPVQAWVHHPLVARAVAHVAEVVGHGVTDFDVRLCAHSGHHARVHATAPGACYHVVWASTASDAADAAVRAALHPAGCCVLVDASSGGVVEVRADAALLPHA